MKTLLSRAWILLLPLLATPAFGHAGRTIADFGVCEGLLLAALALGLAAARRA